MGKALLILGPRRSGKTTLLKKHLASLNEPFLLVTGDDINVRAILSSQSIGKLRSFLGDKTILAVDEAQKIPDIGVNLKLALDNIPGLRILATGSSSLDLAHHTGEPLTGRKFTVRIFPFSLLEIFRETPHHEIQDRLEDLLIYGLYPEVYLEKDTAVKQALLREIVSSYLYRDILEMDGLRSSRKIVKLLQLLALQVGKEASLTELGTQLGMSKNTVEKYLDLLQKAFVLIRLPGFSRNLRKEISKQERYFFYDNGVLNALINNFNPSFLRSDTGGLWENFVIMEMLKAQEISDLTCNNYFWRTHDRKEIALVTERNGRLKAYEIKSAQEKARPPALWTATYPGSEFHLINRANLTDILKETAGYGRDTSCP